MSTRTKTIEWQDPMILVKALGKKTGLEFLLGLTAGTLPPPPISRTLGFGLVEVGEGWARFEGTPDESHYNPIGLVHGGWSATLLDSAMGCAVMSTLDAKSAYTTSQLSVNLVRALTQDTGKVSCEAKVLHRGGRVATAEGRLLDAEGKLLAHATTVCAILSRR
jgi:uncharacterized protein (TIGR00369 family)